MIGDQPIALTGFMTAGKTTIGPQLAMRLGLDFADLDSLLEEQQRASIPELFELHGEESFRRLESEVLAGALEGPPRVLSAGGGVVMLEQNRQLLARRARVVWLDLRFETVMDRLRRNPDSTRPLVGSLGAEGLRMLHQKRRPLYASCAHLRVDADRDAPGRLARRIALHLQREDS
jgi:shikimate kinase